MITFTPSGSRASQTVRAGGGSGKKHCNDQLKQLELA
jgi:hypothetical protein